MPASIPPAPVTYPKVFSKAQERLHAIVAAGRTSKKNKVDTVVFKLTIQRLVDV
jgi:hypothetical protein